MKLAERVLSQGEGHERWNPIVQTEQSALKEDLEREGLW